MRKAIFWLHLVAGIAVGIVILSMAISGTMIAWQRQIIEYAERGFRVHPEVGSAHLAPETLLAKASAAKPGLPYVGLTLRSDSAAPATVTYGRDGVMLLNPYTGEILGEGATQVRGFFRWCIEWHRWLALDGASKETGKAITGAASLGFLGLVISGLYLWWPRCWSAKVLRAIGVPSFKLRGKSRDFNWHNAVGLWCAPLLLMISLTGTIMAYPWANDLLFRLTGTEPPPRREGGGPGPQAAGDKRPMGPGQGDHGRHGGGAESSPWAGLDKVWKTAEQRVAGWRILSVRFGSGSPGLMTFLIDQGDGGRPDLRSTLTMSTKTGEVVRWEPFSSNNAGRQLRMWARFVHTGEAGGWFGQVLATCATTGAIVLVWTGFALAWRRLIPSRKRAREETVLPSLTSETP